MTNLRKVLLKKNNGNVTSLLIGQMFMLILLIYCLFNFRLTMLNAVFNYIDDSVTSSILGGALVNVEEYGKSNQLIIHNNDVYDTVNNTTKGWEQWEADILLSELNYGSDITLTYNELEPKEILNLENRDTHTRNKESNSSTEWINDYYMRRSFSAFMGNLTYNTSNGNDNATYTATNVVPNISSVGALYPGGGGSSLVIDKSVLDKSILGQFVVEDIEITRFDIYNIYRANLAEKHVYMSNYMTYNGELIPSYDVIETIDGSEDILWNAAEPTTDAQFENKYKPHPNVLKSGITRTISRVITEADYTEEINVNYAIQMEQYSRDKKRWEKDLAYYNSGNPRLCYTNSKVTYQGKYKNDKIPFKHFFSQGGNFNIISTAAADPVVADKKAPIVGYSVYSYKSGNSAYGYAASSNMHYYDKIAGTINDIIIDGGKLDGTKIENTALYVEITFTVKTFPTFSSLTTIENAGLQTVTVARLVDIELDDDTN